MNSFKIVRDTTSRVVRLKAKSISFSVGEETVKGVDAEIDINGNYEIGGSPLTSLGFYCSPRYWKQLQVSSVFLFGKLIEGFGFSTTENVARWRIVSVMENTPHMYRVGCRLDGQGNLLSD